MKLNDVKFLPATNAVADVYTKATGLPIVGEMMVAAAGQGGEPTPPTPTQFTFTSIKIIKNAVDDYTIEATSNIPAPVDNARAYLEDSLSQWGGSVSPTENGSTQWVLNPNYEYFFNEGSIPTEGGQCTAWGEFIEGDDHTIHCDWTYEQPAPIYDLNIEFMGGGQATVSASARVDYSADEIYYRSGGVDIRLKPMEGDYTILELDNDYTNRFDDIHSTTLYGTIEVFSPEQGENIATFELEATVTPMFNVMDISVNQDDVDKYSINGSGDFAPREMFDSDCIAEFEGCENPISLYISDYGSIEGFYDGVASFQDGGSVTVTDINNNISWSGTYRYNSLP